MSKSNNTSSGFVKLSRGFFDHYLWSETRTFSKAEAFLDLIQRASFAEHKQLIDGQLITLERGQQIASVRYLAKRWAWSKGKVERFLDGLAHDQMVNRKTGHGQTILTLCNYDAYNSTRDTYGDTHGDSNGTPTGTPTGTKDKKGKKDKKVKNNNMSGYPDAVEQIWKEYPQTGRARSTRKKVHTQWKAMPKDSLDQVLQAIRAWSKSHNWQKDGGQFVPALDRWLRDRGYEDLPHGYAAAQKRTLTERQLKGLDL